MQSQKCDIIIIGGGIIGLATGMRLTKEFPNLKTLILEKEPEVAQHQTGHNSGVIHAGIYYAPGSQKANFCAEGGKMLRRFCDEHDITYEMCGKIIVAVNKTEIPRLDQLYERGTANGAMGLELIGPDRLRELEPHAAGLKAIHSPNTGIVDFSKVSKAYATEIKNHDGEILLNTSVLSMNQRGSYTYLETNSGVISTKHIINCAGLQADTVARMMGVDVGVRIIPFRGEYFSITPDRSDLVRSLIYPVPDPSLPFLGTHFTKRITGEVEAGPNAVLAFAREGYRKTSFNLADTIRMLGFSGFWRMSSKYWKTGFSEQYRSLRKDVFLRSLQTLVPEIRMSDLGEPGSGVRAQAVDRKGALLQDFSIAETTNAIHVLNAPSPGATASLTISRYIVDKARESFKLS